MKNKIIIFDLDGTLSDDSHRRHFIFENNYKEYFQRCSEDIRNEPVCLLNYLLYEAGYIIKIWSGRPDLFLDETIKWLKDNNIKYHELKLKPLNQSHLSANQIKGKWLKELSELPLFVFDDREICIKWWRKNDVFCFGVGEN